MFKQKLKDFLKKFFLHPLVKTPLLGIGILALLALLFFTFLRLFTGHGSYVAVPEFSSLSIQQAKELANSKRLRLEITDSVYIVTRKPGTIVDQNPKSDTRVKPNRKIFVTSNAINPILEEMPNVVGLTLRQAKSVLQLQGFKLGRLTFVADIAVNNVLEQQYAKENIEPGEKIPRGSEITLVLGKGLYNETTILPRVIGMTLSEARNLLHEASLNLGRFTFDDTVLDHSDSLAARVYSQYPNPATMVNIGYGAIVDLWLTLNESRIPVDVEPKKE